MTWKYMKGDKYDLDQLLGFKEFFEQDLLRAINEVHYAQKYENTVCQIGVLKYSEDKWEWKKQKSI